MKMPEVMDTTLRDGEQMDNVSFSPGEKLNIAKKLIEMGINRIEVASARAVKEDEEAIGKICAWAKENNRLDSIEVLGFVDKTESVDWIGKSGGKVINLLAKGSENHCSKQLGKTLDEHLSDIGQTVEYAVGKGMQVNVYLEDWSNGMMHSEDHVFRMVKDLEAMKVRRVMLPDTLGVLSPWTTEEYVKAMLARFPETHFDFHAHNDYDLGTANALSALKAGVHGIHVTANTLGERAGNCSLYAVAAGAKDYLNLDLKVAEEGFYELKRMVEIASGIRMQPTAPIVGENVHRQTSGVHADGDRKARLYMNKLSAERFGKSTKTSYPLGKQSGESSIRMNLEQIGLELDDEALKKVTNRVRELGGVGKTVMPEDLYFIAKDIFEQPKQMPFRFLNAKSDISMTGARIGYVKILLHGEELEATGTGAGGYDAIMNALRSLMAQKDVQLPELTDYQPRIPQGGKTSALVETVIEWKHDDRHFSTIGVDSDQTISAVRATEKMVNIILMKYK
jgi:D-citramalate synthase